jgi:predicted PurR-regulated permease PerM
VYVRAWRYVVGSLAMALMAGLLAYACATALDLPGAAPLALWMGLFDVIPVIGIIVGGLPLVLLAGATSPAWETGLVAVVLVAWQLFETLYLQSQVEKRSLHVGPFITIAVAMVGLELYGIGGALVALVGAVILMALADEVVGLSPEPDSVTSSA